MWSVNEARSTADMLGLPGPEAREEVITAILDAGQRIQEENGTVRDAVQDSSIGYMGGVFSAGLCALLNEHLLNWSEIVTEQVATSEGSWRIDLIDNSYEPIEQVTPRDPFSLLCLSEPFIAFIADITGYTNPVITTRRWVNRYGPGDGIAPHDDTTGDFQIMICLDAPPASYGGTLILENGAEANLQVGDLLVMRHAGVVHWTTPLASTTPRDRATATCRYYVANGRLPKSKLLPHSQVGPHTRGGG
jgi:hypothetical protein